MNRITSAVILDAANAPVGQMRFKPGEPCVVVASRTCHAHRVLIMWEDKSETTLVVGRVLQEGDRIDLRAKQVH